MFDMACQTVRNGAIRQDLLKARQMLEQNRTFGDAFGEPALLDDSLKGMVNTGSISGQLGQSLNQVVETASQQLDTALQAFNQIFQRLVAFSVAMSIVETVVICTH
jgi:type II secretory pathway component PulF